jgi:hypothetical protein
LVNFWILDDINEVEIDAPAIGANRNHHSWDCQPDCKAVACPAFSDFRPPLELGVVHRRSQDLREILGFVPPRPPS